MRNASIAVLREIGVETGGSNVQFAVNPADGRLIIIEMNPRVSRSSALASKATGFPDRQDRGQARRGLHAGRACQRHHRRCDARVLRADHRLCGDQDPTLRLREVPGRQAGAHHLDEIGGRGHGHRPHLPGVAAEGVALDGDGLDRPRRHRFRGARPGRRQERDPRCARHPLPRPPLKVAQALRLGFDETQIFEACHIDPWFIRQLQEIVEYRGARPPAWAAGKRLPVPCAEGLWLLRRATGHARRARDERGGGAAPSARCAPGL